MRKRSLIHGRGKLRLGYSRGEKFDGVTVEAKNYYRTTVMRQLRLFLRRFFFRLIVFSGNNLRLVAFFHMLLRAEAQLQVILSTRSDLTRGLNLEDLRKKTAPNNSTTLFIVGGGPSAYSLTEEELRHYRGGFSIGLNSWDHPGLPKVDLQLEEKISEAMVPDQPKTEQGLVLFHISNRPQIYRAKGGSRRKDYIAPGMHGYSSANIWTSDASVAAHIFVSSCQRPKRYTRSVTGGSQASLLRALWLGIHMGFHEIVLLGIDLSTEIDGVEIPHFTAVTRGVHQIPIVELICAIGLEVESRGIGQVFLARGQGLLRERLPLYEWPGTFPTGQTGPR